MFWLFFAIPFILVLIYAVYHDLKKKPYSTGRSPSDNEDYAYAQSMSEVNRYNNSSGGGPL
ncbi:hypothetical protein D3H55_08310 [Bacillus salacetis]|uniref:Uncharacterized protein n=1 Tax=Bacillus salacetis TaxID=2315464 RepID=A0A3A1R1U0_9BACI|nr:hypothetical protein [Bacillus salacetis]RIW35041.1 hypothetical protein D3H55_08310 [Bacillus salacetis]